jgi:hypothetical protein
VLTLLIHTGPPPPRVVHPMVHPMVPPGGWCTCCLQVEGTPILDVKPYLPCYDSRPLAAGLRQPPWLAQAAPAVCPQ